MVVILKMQSVKNMLWLKFMGTLDGKSTLVQIMAWCRQATCHYLSQYRPKSYSEKAWACDLNGITQQGRLVDGYI